ncbi:hypothetical protein [Dactylosporangium sp. NPDC005555]|uniref:hypothetical protein n=1 Tax=Dactylosporangium sp. NPDC005555 TaxID=3154889 RepID=UPI00339E352F
MHQNVLDLGGTAGTMLLTCYLIGGLITAAAGFLPGNPPKLRLLCVTVGLALSGWAAKVLVLGGVILVGRIVLVLPATLTAAALAGTFRAYSRRRTASARRSRPHPAAARTYTEPPPMPPAPGAPASAGSHPAFAAPVQVFAAPAPTFAAAAPTSAVPMYAADQAPLPSAVPLPRHAPASAAPTSAVPMYADQAPLPSAVPLPRHAPASSAQRTRRMPVVSDAADQAFATSTQPASAASAEKRPHHMRPAAQPRFHGHAIAPPATFPTPPRFAPQPLHNVPSPRRAADDSVTAHTDRPANHLRTPSFPLPSRSLPTRSMPAHSSPAHPSPAHPSPAHPSPAHPSSAQPLPAPEWARTQVWTGVQELPHAQDPTRSRTSSWSQDPTAGPRGVVPSQPNATLMSAPVFAPPQRMALAPVTGPSQLQPSAVRARHRAAGTSA